jgi:hypothetical protein
LEGYCEESKELLGSIKFWEVSEQLHSWQLLEKGSAQWNWLVNALVGFATKGTCFLPSDAF